jgi:YesN/AraC family two-component response regulator
MGLLKKLRNNENTQTLSVVPISGEIDSQTRSTCRALGCWHFLMKPIQLDDLLGILEHYIPDIKRQKETSHSSSSGTQSIHTLNVPPNPYFNRLERYAQMGDINGILEELTTIDDLDEKYHTFTEIIDSYTSMFQIEKIRSYLQHVKETSHVENN